MTTRTPLTDGPQVPFPPPADPAGGDAGPARRPWYRRTGVLVVVVVVVLLAITVVTDLPQNASPKQEAATAAAVVKAIDTDIHPCAFAVRQTFDLYRDEDRSTTTAADRAQIPKLMDDDQAACSFSNGTIFDLSTITVPGSAAGHDMGDVVNTVTLWVTSDALAAIEAIQTLTARPEDRAALTKLDAEERLLASDRAKADADVAAANHLLGSHVAAPALPRLPVPAGGPST